MCHFGWVHFSKVPSDGWYTVFACISFIFIYLYCFEYVFNCKDNGWQKSSIWNQMSLSFSILHPSSLTICHCKRFHFHSHSHQKYNTAWNFGAAVTGNHIVDLDNGCKYHAIYQKQTLRCHNEQTNCYNLTSVQNIFIFKLMTNVFDVEHISMSSGARSRRANVRGTRYVCTAV